MSTQPDMIADTRSAIMENTEEIYRQYIRPLSPADRLRLVEMIMCDLVQQSPESAGESKRSIMELHGLGKELWKGLDVQNYVNTLRDEWDQRRTR